MLLSICNFCRLKGKLRLVISHRVTHPCPIPTAYFKPLRPFPDMNPEAVSCRTWENSSREPCIPQRLPRICWAHGLHHLGVCRLRQLAKSLQSNTFRRNVKPLAQLERLGNKPRELKNKPIQDNTGDTWHTKKHFFTIWILAHTMHMHKHKAHAHGPVHLHEQKQRHRRRHGHRYSL